MCTMIMSEGDSGAPCRPSQSGGIGPGSTFSTVRYRPCSQAARFYTSGTFWAIVVVVVTIVAGAVTVVLWRLGAPRRLIVYSMEPTSLLATSAPRRAVSGLKVSYQDEVLTNPYLVILRVESRSRRDIATADFDAGRPLVFDIGARIVAPVGGGSSVIRSPGGVISYSERQVSVAPLLIRKGQLFRLELLTDGTPHLSCQSPLIDVTVREGGPDRWDIDQRLGAMAFTAPAPLWLVPRRWRRPP